jgi:hypothetical protein
MSGALGSSNIDNVLTENWAHNLRSETTVPPKLQVIYRHPTFSDWLGNAFARSIISLLYPLTNEVKTDRKNKICRQFPL